MMQFSLPSRSFLSILLIVTFLPANVAIAAPDTSDSAARGTVSRPIARPTPITRPSASPFAENATLLNKDSSAADLLSLVPLGTQLTSLKTTLGVPAFASYVGPSDVFWAYPVEDDRAFLVVLTHGPLVTSVQIVQHARYTSKLGLLDGVAMNLPQAKLPADYLKTVDPLVRSHPAPGGVAFVGIDPHLQTVMRFGKTLSDKTLPALIQYRVASGWTPDRAVPLEKTGGGSEPGINAYLTTMSERVYTCGEARWETISSEVASYAGIPLERRMIRCPTSYATRQIFFQISDRVPTGFALSLDAQERFLGAVSRQSSGLRGAAQRYDELASHSLSPRATSSASPGTIYLTFIESSQSNSSSPVGSRLLVPPSGTVTFAISFLYIVDPANPLQSITLSEVTAPSALIQERRHQSRGDSSSSMRAQASGKQPGELSKVASTSSCSVDPTGASEGQAKCTATLSISDNSCIVGTGAFGTGPGAYQSTSNPGCFQTATNAIQFDRPRPSGPCKCGPASGARSPGIDSIGRPVDIVTESLWHEHLDARLGGPFPLEFKRRYDSSNPTFNAGLGYGWHDTYSGYLSIATGASSGKITYYDADNHPQTFLAHGANASAFDSTSGSTLLTNGNGTYTLTTWDGNVFRFTSSGQLSSLTDRSGDTQTIARNSQGLMTGVTDALGRKLSFAYSGSNISGVTSSPVGVHVSFAYGSGSNSCFSGELCSAKESDSSVWAYQYVDPSTVGGNHLLSEVVDPLSHVEESNEYVVNNTPLGPPYQVSTQAVGTNGHVDAFGFSYGTSNVPSSAATVVVTDYRTMSTSGATPESTFTVDQFNQAVTGVKGFLCHCGAGYFNYTLDNWGRVVNSSAAGGFFAFSYGRDLESPTDPSGQSFVTQPYLGPTQVIESGLNSPYGGNRTVSTTYYPLSDVRHDLPQEVDEPSVALPGNVAKTLLTYDTMGHLTEIERTGYTGSTATTDDACFTYNAHGEVLTASEPFNAAQVASCSKAPQVTNLTYFGDSDAMVSERGQIQTVTNPLSQATSFVAPSGASYTIYGEPYAMTDPNGVRMLYGYDELGRPLSSAIDTTVGGVSQYLPARNPSTKQTVTYDADGKPSTRVTGNSDTLVAGYNDSNSLTSLTLSDSSGLQHDQLAYQYDPLARLTSATAASCLPASTTCSNWLTQFSQSYTYDPTLDAAGNLTSINYAGGGTTSLAYSDIQGDLNGWTTGDSTYSYGDKLYFDSARELNQEIPSSGAPPAFYYDLQHNLARVLTSSQSVSYNFDDFGNLSNFVDEAGNVTSYTYDARGDMVGSTDANGATTASVYDNLGRLKSLTATRGSTTELLSYAYDSATAGHFGVGRLASMTDSTGTSVFFYEPRGLLASEKHTVGSTTYATSYTYDADGNALTELRSSPGLSLAYTYDYADRPITLTATKGSATTNFVTAASYEPFGPMTSLSYGNGTTQTRTFTQRYLPLEFKTTNSAETLLGDLAYTEFGTGQIQSITDKVNANYSWTALTYGNGSGDGIKEVDSPNWMSAVYTEQNGENEQKIAIGGSMGRTESITYDNYNRLSSVSDAGNGGTVTADAMSNELAYGSAMYAYTPRNFLGSEVNGNGSFSYVYDALGRRTITATPNGAYTSIYDQGRRLSEESSVGAPTIGHDYVWFGSLPVGQIEESTGTAYWTVTNHLGAPWLLTNSASGVAWQADYEPFGRVYDLRANKVHQPLRLPGQQTVSSVDTVDPTGNGLTTVIDNGSRWLHQNLGRYSQPDPLGYGPNHFNRFNYVGNDPVNEVDPSGLNPFAGLTSAGRQTGLFDALFSPFPSPGFGGLVPGGVVALPGYQEGLSWGHITEETLLIGILSSIGGGGSNTAAVESESGVAAISEEASAATTAETVGDMCPLNAAEEAPSILHNAANGQAFESSVLNALGAAKNTTAFTVDGLGTSIPDMVDAGNITEIKNVLNLSFTNQLQIQAQAAEGSFNLIVSPRTLSISGPLQDAVGASGGSISVFDPATGAFTPW